MICIKTLIISEKTRNLWGFSNYLQKSLKEAFKISKDPKSEPCFVDEALSLNFIEYLFLIKEEITSKENSEEKLEILNFLVGILKNNASDPGVRVKIFEKTNLEIFHHYFHYFFFDEETMNKIENFAKAADFDKRLN